MRQTGPFPSFGETLSFFARRYLPGLLVALLGAALLQAIALSTHAASEIDQLGDPRRAGNQAAQRSVPSPWLADLFLGTSGSFWTPLAPLLALALVGVVACEYVLLASLVVLSSVAVRWLQKNGTPGIQAFFR